MGDVTLSGLHILLAETQEPMRQAIRSGMRGIKHGAGIDFFEAFDGGSALAELAKRRRPFDLAIIGWEMAPMDGATFVKMVRHDSEYALHQTTPIIIVSSLASTRMMTSALEVGVNAVMEKPISPNELAIRILEILNSKVQFVKVESGLGKDKTFVGPVSKWSAEMIIKPALEGKRNIIKI